MTNIVSLDSKRPQPTTIDTALSFLKSLIHDETPSNNRLEFKMNGVVVNCQYIGSSWEEEKYKAMIADHLMSASGMVAMMLLTPHASRGELYTLAAIDFNLWKAMGVSEYYVTARKGAYTYNFRTADHDIARIDFQLTMYE